MKATRALADLVYATRTKGGLDAAEAAEKVVRLLMGPETNCPMSDPDCRETSDGEHDSCQLPAIRVDRLVRMPQPDVVDSEGVAYWGDIDSGGFVSARPPQDAGDFLAGVDMGGLFSTTRMDEQRTEQVALMLLAGSQHATPPRRQRRTPGGFLFRQIPHPLCGESEERERAGLPGHCEDCCAVGHLFAHLDLSCEDVGCEVDHDDVPAEPDPATVDYQVCQEPLGYVHSEPCGAVIEDGGRCQHGHYPEPKHIRHIRREDAR